MGEEPTTNQNAGKPSFWTTLPGILTGLATLLGAIGAFYVTINSGTSHAVVDRPPPPIKAAMGELQRGWNYPHKDIDAAGWLHVISPEACSDLCYRRDDCKAMTYVASNESCWLKFAVPTPIPDVNSISAIKQT